MPATAPATVPYGTPMPAPAAAAAAEPHYASPYYPIPVAGAPAPYTPAPVPGQTQLASAQVPPAAGAPVIQDQAKLAAILGAGAATLPGQAAAQAAAAQQPPIAVIFFRAGSSGLSSRDYSVLHDVVLLQQQQGGNLRVVGHASERTETTDYATHQAINESLSRSGRVRSAAPSCRWALPAAPWPSRASADRGRISTNSCRRAKQETGASKSSSTAEGKPRDHA